MLMNISLKTVHHLHDSKHALTTSSQVLICIGKCDIIASAYNITNLCYFPVSYGADADHMCATADSLCGGKNFQLKDIYTIRFAQDSQIKWINNKNYKVLHLLRIMNFNMHLSSTLKDK